MKRIKTTPENFRHLRLSMSLHEVEDYTFIVFHMVSWPSLFWRKWEQTSISFLGPSFEDSINVIKWTLMSKQSPVESHHHSGALLCWWWCRASYNLNLTKWHSPYKHSVTPYGPYLTYGGTELQRCSLFAKRQLIQESWAWNWELMPKTRGF